MSTTKQEKQCPTCGQSSKAEIFRSGGRIVNILMLGCGHDHDFGPDVEKTAARQRARVINHRHN